MTSSTLSKRTFASAKRNVRSILIVASLVIKVNPTINEKLIQSIRKIQIAFRNLSDLT
jgi:hypothetical protein